MGDVRVAILGPVQVAAAEIGGARLRWLLVRLALAARHTVTVEELARALWPEDKPADPANAVQSLISRLRRSLPEPGALVSVPGGYRLDADTDEHDFDQLVRQAANQPDPAEAAELLDRALELWRGPALGEVAAAPFALGHVVRLEEARLSAIEERAHAQLAGGKAPDRLVAELGELAARHPLRERLHALRIQALREAGRHGEALAAFEQIRARLADELGADPGPKLRELHAVLLAAQPAAPARSNLRAPLTSFVGRDQELRRLRELLAGQRLITLVGPGGAGKTRLATTVAQELDHAVWVVELAPVSDPGDVPHAVLSALGQRPRPTATVTRRDTLTTIIEALSGPPVLLILDNCEHLLDATARLAEELLGRCPRLRVLATSREPLAIGGETLSPVPPLPQEPAVRLFCDRVAAVQPGFTLDEGNQATVREICRRLDGLPLAIELAAARLRSLSLTQLADRLDDRFRLLSGGSRTALPRHQTLRAVVAWSWDLLESAERELAEQLSVFAGGFDLEAAEHLGGTLDLLAALVDKSLLQPSGEGRYRMLETIREYGLERLAGGGRIIAARAAHTAYFLALAERAEPILRSHDQLVWIARLVAEYDNLLAALHFALDSEDSDTAVRMAAALGVFWEIRGNAGEAPTWLGAALRLPGPAPLQAKLIASAVFLINGVMEEEDGASIDMIEQLRQLSHSVEDGPVHPVVAMLEPAVALFTDDYALGMRSVQRRLSHPDPWARGMVLNIRAAMKENDGDMAGSREDLLAAVAQLRPVGERWGLSMALTSLAEVHAVFGDYEQAIEAMNEAVELIGQLNPEVDPGHQRVWQTTIRIRSGEVERARAELQVLTHAVPSPGVNGHTAAFAHVALGDLYRLEGDLDAAGACYQRAGELLEGASAVAPQFRSLVLTGQACLALARGLHQEAAELLARAAQMTLRAKDMPVLAKVGVGVADLHARLGEPEQAARLLGAGEQLRGAPDADNPDVARLAAQLGAELGQDAYRAEHARGRALGRDAALALVCEPQVRLR